MIYIPSHVTITRFVLISVLCGMLCFISACQQTATTQHTSVPTAVAIVAATATPTPTPTSTPTFTTTPTPTPTNTPTNTPTPTSTPTPERAFERGIAHYRPIAVMIDNFGDAYPQYGLDTAVQVFEAEVENGITRYMAVFVPGISPDAEVIAPVRSVRPYFVQWARGLHAMLVYIGGSPDGLALSESAPEVISVNAMYGIAGSYFYRSNERTAPHNLFTSSELLQQFNADSGYDDLMPFDAADAADNGWLFKPDAPPAIRPTQQRISYYFLFPDDVAGWEYTPTTNSYLRLWRGEPQPDATTSKQLSFKNVVVMEVAGWAIAGDTDGRIAMEVVGEGHARIFTDGIERDGQWRKPAAASPLRFYDAGGVEIRFNAGAVWIVALPSLDNLLVE